MRSFIKCGRRRNEKHAIKAIKDVVTYDYDAN